MKVTTTLVSKSVVATRRVIVRWHLGSVRLDLMATLPYAFHTLVVTAVHCADLRSHASSQSRGVIPTCWPHSA